MDPNIIKQIPFNLGKGGSIFWINNVLKGSQQDIKVSLSDLHRQILPGFWRTLVNDFGNRWSPFVKLKNPIGHRGKWDDDQERSRLSLLFNQVSYQR